MAKHLDNGAAATWAIVALKNPAEAKSRLRAHCSDDERHSLYFLMARRVLLALLAVPAIEKVLVVTASDEVEKFVRGLGASVIRQPQDLGTQSAFAHALSFIRSCETAHPARLLMISGDIPLITAAAISELLDRCRFHRGVAVIPDQRRLGTNALVCSPPDAIEPCFGDDSLRRHCSAARAGGYEVQVIESSALSLDIDDYEDLILLSERLTSGTGSDLDSALIAWLNRAGVIENADCA